MPAGIYRHIYFHQEKKRILTEVAKPAKGGGMVTLRGITCWFFILIDDVDF